MKCMIIHFLKCQLKGDCVMEKRINGCKETFVVKIEYCQNGTWQGKLVWADTNKTMRFRSTLELIRLMDEAIKSDQLINGDNADHFVS